MSQPQVRKEKIEYLDLFRCFAILAVILIHATSQPVAKLPTESTFFPMYFVMNSGSQFAVPSFLFLSALVLFYNYSGKANTVLSWIAFFRKRATYIIVPYILWSVFYFLVTRYFGGASLTAGWDIFFQKLFRGTNYTHLYFIIVIVQFYVLFPFLMILANKASWFSKNLVWFGIALQIGFFYWNKSVLHVTSTGSVFFTYLLFYFIGAYVGMHFKAFMSKAVSRKWLWFGLWALSFAFYIGKGWMRLTHQGWMQDYIIQINFVAYYAYVSLTCIALCLIAQQLHHRFGGKLRILFSWGALSFGLYFIHPAVLLVWRKVFVTSDPVLYHVSIFGGFAAALLGAWIASIVISRFKGAWLLLGK